MEAAAGLPHNARRHAEELVCLSNEHGFPLWLGLGLSPAGSVIDSSWTGAGWPRGAREGALGTFVVLERWCTHRAPSAFSPRLTPRSVICRRGRNVRVEAAQLVETTQERSGEAELHQLRGDIMNARGDHAAAEQEFIIERSLWRSARARRLCGCALRPASPTCGANKASAWKLTTSSRRCMAGSPKASTRRSCGTPGHCSTSRPDAHSPVCTENPVRVDDVMEWPKLAE